GAVVTISLAGRGTYWAFLAGAALVVWLGYFYRLANLVVVVRGDVLTVRSLTSTRHVHCSEVAAVRLGESSVAKSPNRAVIIETAQGREICPDACARQIQTRRERRRVEDFHKRLCQWARLPETGLAEEAIAMVAE